MPIGLGIGLNISMRGGLGGSGFSLTAPVLTRTSADSDNTVVFSAPQPADPPVGLRLEVEVDTDSAFTPPPTTTELEDAVGDPATLETTALSDDTYYARARWTDASNNALSDWGLLDTVSFTITTVAGPPTITYVTTVDGAISGSNSTAADADIGTAAASRRVIVGVSCRNSSSRTILSATIGGVAATIHGSPVTSGVEYVQYISAIVPTGTAGTIDVVWSASRSTGPDAFHIFTVDEDDLTSSTPTLIGASTAGDTTLTNDIDVDEGGFVILVAAWGNGTTKTPVGSGETAVTDVVYSQRYFTFYSGSNLSANAAWTGTVNWTGSFAGSMQMATWR